jgi:hypothetical protein
MQNYKIFTSQPSILSRPFLPNFLFKILKKTFTRIQIIEVIVLCLFAASLRYLPTDFGLFPIRELFRFSLNKKKPRKFETFFDCV